MPGLRTPLLIKCWYCFVVMMILYSLPTLDSVKLISNQSSIPTQASSNTTVLPTLRPSLFLTPIPSLPPKIVSTTSSPIVATSSPPSPFTPTRMFCIGVRNKFTTSDGNNCSFYDYESNDDGSNYYGSNGNRCSNDTDPFTNYYAKDVCAECGECFDPLIANTSPPTSG